MSSVIRTYASRPRGNPAPPSSPPSTLSSSPAPVRKRTFSESLTKENSPLFPAAKRKKESSKTLKSSKSKNLLLKSAAKQKSLTQLHFIVDGTTLRTCALCDLTFNKGAPDDEALHKAHCTRVQQGMEWGREEARDCVRNGHDIVTVVRHDVKLKGGKKGRIVSVPVDTKGKIGSKLSTLIRTMNLALSAPDLPTSSLRSSKAYLFLLPHESHLHRERIAGCVIAQRISTAMAVVPSPPASSEPQDSVSRTATLVSVDPSTGLFCDPTPLPTPMGIPRLFVPTTHRRLGIACHLLDAAAETFIHGCPLDARKGQVAFTQPTGMGQQVMNAWGQGGVRVYEE